MAGALELSSHTPPSEMVDLQQMTMWPATTQALVRTDTRRQIMQPTKELEQILKKENTFADLQKFEELLKFSQPGVTYKDSLARLWENKQANAVSLLREQIDSLKQRRIEAERLKKEILDGLTVESLYGDPDRDEDMLEPVSIGEGFVCDEGASSWHSVPESVSSLSENEGDYTCDYWREKAKSLNKLLSESLKREEALSKKLQENSALDLPSRLSSELHQQFGRFDNFLRFALRRAPVVVGHQDTELRYVFIHNAFPTLTEEEVIGKTDEEIYQGMGVPELMEFKREVIRTGSPDKREIKFNTNLFGVKTFLIAVEPVFNTSNVCIGVNYVAMDVTVQVAKREKLARLLEEDAVQVAMESELTKTIHITEETMRAKQLLATMSHEIRSPLSGVVSMATVLARTPLNEEQKPLVELMVQSGEIMLQLINDILDLSKVEAGAMTFEAKKFRPREVVRHVLQMQLVSLAAENKNLHLEGHITDDVPLEVIGDVLRIRQVLTNLVSNAVKFTHTGKVSIVVRVGSSSSTTNDSIPKQRRENYVAATTQQSPAQAALPSIERPPTPSQQSRHQKLNGAVADPSVCPRQPSHSFQKDGLAEPLSSPLSRPVEASDLCQSCQMSDSVAKTSNRQQRGEETSVPPLPCSKPIDLEPLTNMEEDGEDIVWLHCHIIDTGIGIPAAAIPTLFQRYAQASTTHARMYGGTGLGLAICKQLVELMGGTISVVSKVKEGSTFSFKLPLRVPKQTESSGICSDDVPSSVSDEPERTTDTSHDDLMYSKIPGSLQFSSNMATSSHIPQVSAPKNHVRRQMKVNQSLRVFNTPSRIGTDQRNSSTAPLSHKRDLLLTSSNGNLENASVGESKPVQSKEYGHCLGHDNIIHMNSQGGIMPHYQTQGFPVNKMHGGSTQKGLHNKIRSPPGQGHARKMGKTQISDRRAAINGPFPMASKGVKQIRPCRILLAEDNQVNVKVTTHMMSSLGHDLTVVSNGAEAIRALQQGSYDLVLMDVYMPVMDGLEATQCIRKFEETGSWAAIDEAEGSSRGSDAANNCPRWPSSPRDSGIQRKKRLPIIAMTANALVDNIQDCYEHGMDSFIAKPVKLDKLEEVLNLWLPSSEYQI